MSDGNVKKDAYMTSYGDKIEFSFKTSLTSYEKVAFVNTVTNLLVGDNYNSVIRDLIFDFVIIDMFSDADVKVLREDGDDSEYDINDMDNLVNNTTIADIVKVNVEDGVLEELEQAVDLNVEYRTGIRSSSIEKSLAGLVDTIEKKVDDLDLDNALEIAKKVSDISNELTADNVLDAYANNESFKNSVAALA